MRNLLLSLMVLASLVSCGKDSKSGSVNGSSSSAITLDDTVAKQLGTLIDNSTSYFPAATTSPTARYAYVVTTVTSSQPVCETKEGWLGIKYTVCKAPTTSNATPSSYVQVSTINLEAKRAELRSYINSSNAGGLIFNGTGYTVRSTSGVVYTIDPRYPIQANPVMVQQVNGEIKYFAGQTVY
jgi:hypothetical protein